MFEEIVPVVVETLISNNRKLTITEIQEISDLELPMLNRTVRILKDLGIVAITNNNVVLSKELKASQLAAAAQMGVDLSSFSDFFKIDKKEKQLAIELASHAEKVKNLDITKRKPLVQTRAYYNFKKSDDVTVILQNLLEASNNALCEYMAKIAVKDKQLAALIELHSNAENSLLSYVKDKK